jgi:hypothetical protein
MQVCRAKGTTAAGVLLSTANPQLITEGRHDSKWGFVDPWKGRQMSERRTWTEEIKTTGEQLVGTVKGLVHEGNIRRIIVKGEEGRTLIEIPLTLGVVGALLVPVAAALGAIAALVSECTIVVEKVGD